jgi:hypothetical protein
MMTKHEAEAYMQGKNKKQKHAPTVEQHDPKFNQNKLHPVWSPTLNIQTLMDWS